MRLHEKKSNLKFSGNLSGRIEYASHHHLRLSNIYLFCSTLLSLNLTDFKLLAKKRKKYVIPGNSGWNVILNTRLPVNLRLLPKNHYGIRICG